MFFTLQIMMDGIELQVVVGLLFITVVIDGDE